MHAFGSFMVAFMQTARAYRNAAGMNLIGHVSPERSTLEPGKDQSTKNQDMES